ncbi:MAG: extensin family protein, partial [Myxococcota bacterium]
AHGLAIDIWGFVDDQGQQLVIEEDWEIDNDTPEHPRGRLLHTLVDELFEARVFNIILTPDYNAAHRNHLHLDLTPDAHFLGSTTADIGERCPGW